MGNLSAARFTIAGCEMRPYKDWGNELFVALNPLDTNNVIISSFSFSAATSGGGDANVFYSTMPEPPGPSSSRCFRPRGV
jgi:hypothetical protein